MLSSSAERWVSGRHVGRQLLGQRGQHAVDLLGERPVVRAEEHRLLLHAERELVAADQSAQCSLMPPAPSRRAAEASTSALNRAAFSGRAVSTSACHCTPSTNGRAGASTPSITPSGDQATARSPLPSRLIAWWWKEFTRARRRRITRCRRLPGVISTECVTLSPARVWRCSSVVPGPVGQVLVERAAARHVQRLQAAADGEDGDAARVRAAGDLELEEVELGLHGPELGVAALVVGGRVEVGAAGEADARQAVEQRLDRLDLQRRHHHRDAAGRLDRLAGRSGPSAISRRGGSPCGVGSTLSARRTSDVVTPMRGLMPPAMCPSRLRRASCSRSSPRRRRRRA